MTHARVSLSLGFCFLLFSLACEEAAMSIETQSPDRGPSGVDTRPEAAGADAGAAPAAALRVVRWNGRFSSRWADVERLENDQKFEEADGVVGEILAAAEKGRQSEEWVRCLVRRVRLRTGLHGYETAVRFLREQPWPDDLLGATVLNLYYGQALVHYAQAYSWEIRQRERVEAKGPVDLKAWTLEQIYAEALAAFGRVYAQREALSAFSAADIKDYLTRNGFPPDVRPTLRDAVTYLLVELLADSSGWRPEQANEIYRLDLGALIGDGLPPVDLADAAVHPLVKVATVLDDLEVWHRAQKHTAAALEARLERLRRLRDSFSNAADVERLRQHLSERLAGLRDTEWWAEGMATLAEFTEGGADPEALVEARRIAAEGRSAYPQSIGGQHCRAVVERIDQPSYELAAMAADAPNRRSLGLTYRNLGEIHFRAYPLDLQAHVEGASDSELFPSGRELEALVARRKPAHEWSVALEPTPDHRLHRAYVTPPMTEPSAYVVVASARKDFASSRNVLQAATIVVGDLVLLSETFDNTLEVRVLTAAGGLPVADAQVFLYRTDWRQGHRLAGTKKTDSDGVARFVAAPGSPYFVLARRGRDVAIEPDYLYFSQPTPPVERTQTLLYTDRSIYRPLQTLHFKAVAYVGRADRADFRAAPKTALTVSLVDPNQQTVESKELVTNDYGTASGSFTLPSGRLLGSWTLRSSLGGMSSVRVEEYKRPTFEVRLVDPPAALRLNEPAVLKGEARYYFGLPVATGEVHWRVERTPQYPTWWWSEWTPPGDSRQTVAAGAASIEADGSFTLTFEPQADARLAKDVSYRYRVTADVTDEGGETRTAERTFRLGFVAVEAALQAEREFFDDNVAGHFTLHRTNLDGNPAPGTGRYRLHRIQGPERALLPADQPLPKPPAGQKAPYQTSGDRLRPRWAPGYDPAAVLRQWNDGPQVATGELTHNDKGVAELDLPALPPGAYRLHYETKDAFGESYETRQEFLVAGARADLPLPAVALVQRASVPVGEQARLFVHTGLAAEPGLPAPVMTVDFYRDGQRFERRAVLAGSGASVIDVPVREEWRGGFAVVVTLVRDHQVMQFQRTVLVPWDNKELKVAFRTFRDTLRPGAAETFDIVVTGPAGKDTAVAAAELLAYMYDRSLDAFAPHSPPTPSAVFPYRGTAGYVRTNLGQARRAWVPCDGFPSPASYVRPSADSLIFLANYGIGGPGGRGGYYYAPGMRNRMMLAPPAPSAAPVAKMALREEADGESRAAGQAPAQPTEATTAVTESPAVPPPDDGRAAAGAEPALRTNFSETAFWQPHLLTGPDGSATLSFSVPDSVTGWNLWVHAITRDLSSGSVKGELKTVKDLMVRPYLPRFLREGDRAELKVVVNNASPHPMTGEVTLDILDPATGQSVLAQFGVTGPTTLPFTVAVNGSGDVTFPLTTPARVGLVAFRVTAQAGAVSDGEQRAVPLLPGRMHLAQSRFVTLRDRARRELRFDDLARDDDPSRIQEQLVVTVDAQLFYAVLSALPYLVNYPYECSEQTLNRFLSTGILTSFYDQYPAMKRMAESFAKRETPLEAWDQSDPNRKMALEETPWLQEAKGGVTPDAGLLRVLDPRVAEAQRNAALALLRKSQTGLGAFPWFPGGPPSPYITLYLVHGFSKGLEFGVDVPRDMVQRAWAYLHRHYIDDLVRIMQREDCCWEFITFLNYVLSNYPDASWTGGVFSEAERKQMLDFSFAHWKAHAPYLKGYLALTLHRAGRAADARLVWASVMDSAKTAEDQGTFWAPEDRGWLWYNDRIETHAFALRTTMELTPDDARLDGLVLWLFLNKKLNHWKSTRATAEVLYSLAHFLKKKGQLGVREETTVTIGDLKRTFVFEADEYTGQKNQIVVPGEQIVPQKMATVVVEKTTPGFQFASATWHFSTERLPTEASGDFLGVTRQFFRRVKTGREVLLAPLVDGTVIEPGDEIEVQLSIRTKHPLEYVHLRDPRAAGCEPVSAVSRYRYDLGIGWYEEIRDSGTNFFFENLPQGEYTFKYRVRAAMAGTFKVAPATLQPMYAPEFTAYSAGNVLSIKAVE